MPRLSQVCRIGGDWQVTGPIAVTRNGMIFKAENPNAPFPLAVKYSYPQTTTEAGLQRQYETLQRYHDAMPQVERLSVPQPVWVDASLRTMAMRWIEEPLMTVGLLNAGFNRPERHDYLKTAGRWLRRFHECNPIVSKPLNPDPAINQVKTRFAGVPESQHGLWSYRYLIRCLKAIDRHHASFKGTRLDHGWVHGDFTPTNIMTGPDRTTGIDFMPAKQGALVTDICRFMAYADVYQWGLTVPWRMNAICGDRDDLAAFLEGYEAELAGIDAPVMTYLQLIEVSRRIATRSVALIDQGRSFGRIAEQHRLCRRAACLIRRLG